MGSCRGEWGGRGEVLLSGKPGGKTPDSERSTQNQEQARASQAARSDGSSSDKVLARPGRSQDEVLCRIIEIADDDELEEIKKIIVEDLAATLRDFLYSMQERGILGEEDLYSLEGVIQAVRLSLLGQRSPAPLAR